MSNTTLLGRRLVIIGCMALLLAVMSLVWRAGLASLYYFPASFRLEQWDKVNVKPQADDLAATAELAQSALALQPDNPHYLLLNAKINEWRWFSGVLSSAEVAANEAIYQKAIALRPSWPVAYADHGYFLAATQLRLTEAWQQLLVARQKGPYLPEVQQKFLAVAFSFWPQLSVAQKAEVYRLIEAGMSGALFNITRSTVQQFNKQQLVCQYLRVKQSPVWHKVQTNLCARFR